MNAKGTILLCYVEDAIIIMMENLILGLPMAVVKDKQATLEFANKLANHLIQEMAERAQKFYGDNDPAEHIYLMCHTLGNLTAKMCIALEGYGKVYGIPSLTASVVNATIDSIKNALVDFNKEQTHYKKETMQ